MSALPSPGHLECRSAEYSMFTQSSSGERVSRENPSEEYTFAPSFENSRPPLLISGGLTRNSSQSVLCHRGNLLVESTRPSRQPKRSTTGYQISCKHGQATAVRPRAITAQKTKPYVLRTCRRSLRVCEALACGARKPTKSDEVCTRCTLLKQSGG